MNYMIKNGMTVLPHTLTVRKLIANRLNFQKCNDLGLNKHFGENNIKWKGGVSRKQNYPCPKCGQDRYCQKRYAHLLCRKCSNSNHNKYIEHKKDGTYRKQ